MLTLSTDVVDGATTEITMPWTEVKRNQ